MTAHRFTVTLALAWIAAAATAAEPVDFTRDVQPILASRCLGCHGAEKPKAGLSLADRGPATSPVKSGRRAIVPGDTAASELVRRIRATSPDERMPPTGKEPLKPDQIATLERWIAAGAPWRRHWAFEPLARVETPAVADARSPRGEIDGFVRARLEREAIQPSPEADRVTLAKRLAYDLLGLPLESAELDDFAADPAPDAYERLLDRLLASPHVGERWGRHWLDLARFADSDGYEKDRARPDAHLFRDWVIASINEDQPLDRFTVEQIAGDLLDGATSRQKIATAFQRQTLTNEEGGVDQEEYRVAAAFDRVETVGTVWLGLTVGCVRCHSHKYDPLPHEEYYKLFAFFNDADEVTSHVPAGGGDLAALEAELAPLEAGLADRYAELAPAAVQWQDEQHRRILAQPSSPLGEVAAEIAEAAAGGDEQGAALALTLRAGAVELTGLKIQPPDGDGGPTLALLGAEVIEAGSAPRPVELHRVKTDKSRTLRARTREPLALPAGTAVRLRLEAKGGAVEAGKLKVALLTGDARGLHLEDEGIADALEMYPEKRVASTQRRLLDHYVLEVVGDERARELRKRIAGLLRERGVETTEVRTLGRPVLHRVTRRFDRGDFLAPLEAVAPGVPAVLHPLHPLRPRAPVADRLDLARWLVAPDAFLTPRVLSNQAWARLLGAGLVRTLGDFGVRGEPPSHPEILDWLAASLRERWGWSRKRLIRAIATSAVYRQSSRHRPELAGRDPLNALLARQGRFRVEGEIVRDIALAASGLLTRRIGGPSVFPAMPEDLAALSYANSFTWKPSAGEDRFRRGLYTFFKRTIPHPALMTFDCPDANVAAVARTASNTPLQALHLLNNEAHVEAAQALARRLIAESASIDGERVERGFRLTVGRRPSPMEVDTLARTLEAARRCYADDVDGAKRLVGTLGPVGIDPREAAAWTAVARILLNLDELITRE